MAPSARYTCLAALGLLVGCGPVTYAVDIAAAERAVVVARASNASYYAPYELSFAEAHLEKAREEAAEGAYEDAIDLATAAEAYGRRALDLSTRPGSTDR
ncbi:MAG TPA: DUF4398 domain-containing protein [Polyangiales bacterium]|jgi:hypothetical protein